MTRIRKRRTFHSGMESARCRQCQRLTAQQRQERDAAMADARWIGLDRFVADMKRMRRETDKQMRRQMRRVSVASARAARRAAKVHRRTGALARSVKPRRGSKTGAGYKCLFYARANPRLRHIYEASKAAAEAKLRADGGGVGVLRRIVGD